MHTGVMKGCMLSMQDPWLILTVIPPSMATVSSALQHAVDAGHQAGAGWAQSGTEVQAPHQQRQDLASNAQHAVDQPIGLLAS